jgi:Restriction endonuclease
MSSQSKRSLESPDAHLEGIVAQARAITEAWGKRHDFWHDAGHHDPIKHYDSEPGEGGPILLFWSEGEAIRSISDDEAEAFELRNELERVGLYMEMDDNVTAGYYLIDYESELQKEFDRFAQWKWMCRLIEPDTEEVSGDLYKWFAENPQDFHRLPPRAFEELVSSIFNARGWRTEVGPGTGDGGVDLRMWQEDPLGDLLTLVQVKRYAAHRPIILDAVAALEAHVNREGANSGLFITTSRYLPGVQKWASRNRSLTLADSTDLQKWCVESAQEIRQARSRAMAMEAFQPLVREIREANSQSRLVVNNGSHPSFCVVLRETQTGALLVHIPSTRVSGDSNRGQVMPVLDGSVISDMPGGPVFRAIRKQSDHEIHYWGKRTYYGVWDGRPCGYDHWD